MDAPIYGFVTDLWEDPASATGYRGSFLLVRGGDETFDVSRAVYDLQADYTFPMMSEFCFVLEQSEDGTVTNLLRGMDGIMRAQYTYGSPRTIGSTLEIDGGIFTFTGFSDQWKAGQIAYYDDYKLLDAIPAASGLRQKLSRGALYLCLDWTRGDTCFSRVSQAYVISNLKENVYWITLYDLFDDTEGYDCVAIFLNAPKDPESLGGNLAKKDEKAT